MHKCICIYAYVYSIYIYSTILLHNTRECNKFGRIEDWLGRELSNKECGGRRPTIVQGT